MSTTTLSVRHRSEKTYSEQRKRAFKPVLTECLRSIYVNNLDGRVTRRLLYELMIQAGPVESIKLESNNQKNLGCKAIVRYEHDVSARYAFLAFRSVSLFGSKMCLSLKPPQYKNQTQYPPYSPTFFECPDGLHLLRERDSFHVIPPSKYKAKNYIKNSKSSIHFQSSTQRLSENEKSNTKFRLSCKGNGEYNKGIKKL